VISGLKTGVELKRNNFYRNLGPLGGHVLLANVTEEETMLVSLTTIRSKAFFTAGCLISFSSLILSISYYVPQLQKEYSASTLVVLNQSLQTIISQTPIQEREPTLKKYLPILERVKNNFERHHGYWLNIYNDYLQVATFYLLKHDLYQAINSTFRSLYFHPYYSEGFRALGFLIYKKTGDTDSAQKCVRYADALIAGSNILDSDRTMCLESAQKILEDYPKKHGEN